jgi:guanylate kinase
LKYEIRNMDLKMDLTTIDNGLSGKGLLFVISSVSGGGKTTVISELMGVLGDLRMSVSHTTRKPRPGEVEGRDYHFVDKNRFKMMVNEGLFLEWAQVYGQLYGTSQNTVDSFTEKGFDVLLDIDVQGGMQVKEREKDGILIFIVAPGEEEQERRLKDRGTENDHELSLRLEAARRELAFINEYHYSVLNDDIINAVDTVSSIIKAERCRNRSKTAIQASGGNKRNET